MNRRKFISFVGCGCLSLGLHSCTSTPITDRKQLKLIPEHKLNAQAAKIYEKVKEKEELSDDAKKLKEGKYSEMKGYEGFVLGKVLIRHKDLKIFGLQFHPESILTTDGKTILANFINL